MALACDVIASPAKACVMRRSASLVSLPRSDSPAASTAARKRAEEGHFLQVHRRQSRYRRPVIRAGDDSKPSLPWGDKRYFSREQFRGSETDRSLLQDRGFRRTRPTMSTQQRSDGCQDHRHCFGRNPIIVSGSSFKGSKSLPEQHRHSLGRPSRTRRHWLHFCRRAAVR
jgi:hypothetical protein